MGRVTGEYRWIRAEGEGVYEIPVGPVHAGIIEPGHFRFQAVGEEILNLEERLGYVHKGIEKRFEALSWEEGARLPNLWPAARPPTSRCFGYRASSSTRRRGR